MIRRNLLLGRLNPLAFKSIQGAYELCELRGNPYVELSHWIYQILQAGDSDLLRIVRGFELDPARLNAELTRALDRLPRGATAVSSYSPHVGEAVERGWVYTSLLFNESKVRTGHLLVGILNSPNLYEVLLRAVPSFAKLNAEALLGRFAELTAGSPEAAAAGEQPSAAGAGAAGSVVTPASSAKQEALNRFAVDLTERARKGELDPVLGRDEEIRQVIDILMRRRQNNPLLAGEAGVGKTAVVEGFALRIAHGDVPPALRNVSLRALDLGLLQAGAGVKGEFENRLRQVIDEVQSSPQPIILFIDEAHMLIGAGGPAGQGDAANLLKPAL
ncbi:MAG: AAA family ATPase, partial [Verrucomicrobia bacterium]|nr:AAA family ATPase [Verrucomicrobiota bacterium]